jgi:hypothetical protein
MIARMWRGVTRASSADEYTRYIEETGLRAYGETPGNMGSFILRRPADDTVSSSPDTDGVPLTEFLVLSFWESMDAVRRFAGPTPETAVFYPQDDQYLVRRGLTVDHYEVVARGAEGGWRKAEGGS